MAMLARDTVDLDKIVDYRAEYEAVIKKSRVTGDNLTGLCPFHDDKNNSFSVDLKTGQWKCFAEDDGGNFVSFYARLHNVDTKTAYHEILAKYHIEPSPTQKGKKTGETESTMTSYTLAQYSFEKRLPEDFLAEVCHVSTGKERNGLSYLRMPYLDAEGKEATYRKRFGNKEFRWRYGSAGKICLYGLWRIQAIRDVNYAIMVEGESDTQTLWYMDLPALGVAGAVMFKPEQAADLQDLKLYIHQEPDQGGETFVTKVCNGLRQGGFIGEVYIWSCSWLGVKDPSNLYMKHGKEEAAKMIRGALRDAKRIDINEEHIPEAISGAPINLRQPEGWIYSESGISEISEKKHAPVCVCRTPIILTRRIKGIDTGDEKIEIAYKRDGQWATAIYPRSTIFSSRSITILTDLGCTVTSENAKQVVRFLGALEAENIDIIPKVDATGTFGWQPGSRFIPGKDEGIVLDIDPSQRGMAAAYCQNGTLEHWTQVMAPHRDRDKFRFIMAASFAAPLLRIVKQRIFFIYNWGGSKGGKTATLKAALSAWGDPDRLMVNFNATQVGLERTASFYCDLPLGIDERQLAGTKQEALEKIVYMISSGTGKIRGSKGGGLQTTNQWRTVALATGEEPISTDTTQTGVSTRVLEIYGGPFDSEQDAGMMHQQAVMDCGWAGPAFIKKVVALKERDICEAYEAMLGYVRAMSDGKNGSHLAGISVVALADAMIDSWLFDGLVREPPPMASGPEVLQRLGVSVASWIRAKQMAADILINQVQSNSTDVNENATQYLVDWILSNKAFFGTNAIGTCLGMISETGNVVQIFPSMLNQALAKAGYNPRKTMKYLAEQGLITIEEKDGKKAYSVVRRFGSRVCRFVEFHIGKVSENKDPLDELEDLADAPLPEEWTKPGSAFHELPDPEPHQEQLPF